MAVIRLKGVSLYYDDGPVLTDVDVVFESGRITCLLGPNGCGKSTLLSALMGLVRYTGSILIRGKEIKEYGRKETARLLAFVPQFHHPAFAYSVLEVVLAGRNPHVGYLPGKHDYERAVECIDMVGAGHLARRPYNRISGGERQLVLIARALCQNTEIILFDEPTSALDYKNTYRVMTLIKKLSREHALTCLVTVHDPNLALLFGDEVAAFKNGELVKGTPEEMITGKSIMEIYGMKAGVFNNNGVKFVVPSVASQGRHTIGDGYGRR